MPKYGQGWNADHYLQFARERTRPARDLVARVEVEAPGLVVDLGCGPGNSTLVLGERWPGARILGLDSSPEMITAARERHPDGEWEQGDISRWIPPTEVDVLFSSAALHWVGDHEHLLPHLLAQVAPGGALAFQIPHSRKARFRRHIIEVSQDPRWSPRMEEARRRFTMEDPSRYHDLLAGIAQRLDMWETEYFHVLEDHDTIIRWISSTGLRPYLEALHDEREQSSFMEVLRERITGSYPPQDDGTILFPFRRLFLVAYI